MYKQTTLVQMRACLLKHKRTWQSVSNPIEPDCVRISVFVCLPRARSILIGIRFSTAHSNSVHQEFRCFRSKQVARIVLMVKNRRTKNDPAKKERESEENIASRANTHKLDFHDQLQGIQKLNVNVKEKHRKKSVHVLDLLACMEPR